MISFGKSKRTMNIVIDDYILRIVENNGKDLSSISTLAEKIIPLGTIQNGRIVDELAFYELVKEVVEKYRLKNRLTRFYVPQEMAIVREIQIPEDVKENGMKEYVTMEIGNTIHFPFKDPVFDLYKVPQLENKVRIIAAPEEEIVKYVQIFSDVDLKPVAVDMQSLGVYRYFIHQQEILQEEKVYLLLEMSLIAANISIFHEHLLDFHRYQPLSLSMENWEMSEQQPYTFTFKKDDSYLRGIIENLMTEIERLMNFYRFSIHQGEKEITNIVLFGDFPHLHLIEEAVKQFDLPVKILNVTETTKDGPISRAFIPALGLALKGGK